MTLLDTWRAMESLVDRRRCRAIGLSDITLDGLLPIYESARIKPAVVQVEAHPYLPESELLEFCKKKRHRVFGLCTIGSRNKAGAARRSSYFGNCRTSWQDASTGAVSLGGTAWHGSAYHASNYSPRAGEFQHLRPSGRRTRRNQSNSD
jgi:hypothetical protein